MHTIIEVSLDDIDDAPTAEIAVPRTISKDVQSRRSYIERRTFARFDEEITKVEQPPTMSELVAKRAA